MKQLVPQIPPRPRFRVRLARGIKQAFIPPTLLLRRRRIARYLSREPRPKLQIGCGPHRLPGWLNTDLSLLNRRDIVYVDARKRLPFSGEAFYFVFNEHFISHLTLEEALRFLRECYRVLKPNGVLRTATAGWPFLLKLYTEDSALYQEYTRWATELFLHTSHSSRCLVINNFLYGFDLKCIYDAETLSKLLSLAGFSEIVQTEIGQSVHRELCGVEGHGKFIPSEFNTLETFVLEATKV